MIITGGSDCPVETYDPIKGIYAAVTRKDFDGYPSDGYYPDEKLSVYEAVCAYTKTFTMLRGSRKYWELLRVGSLLI